MITITSIAITAAEIELVTKALAAGHLVQGKLVEELETTVASYLGVDHAVAVNSGTAALHTALHAAGIKPGDEVITTPFSFVATANAILMCGATPVFADIDDKSFTIDPQSAESLITTKTKAILAVDLYGNPVDYEALKKICTAHHVPLIADSCQALGATYKSQKVGSLADVSVFSLYASKNIFSGEGGLITTNSTGIADRARLFRNHGQMYGKPYEYHGLGYNYRLTDVLAAIAIPQLAEINRLTGDRQNNARYLSAGLEDTQGIVTPPIESGIEHCFHQYTVKITEDFPLTRDELQAHLLSKDIESRVYYPRLLSTIPHVIAHSRPTPTPCADTIVNQVLSLPVHQHLSTADLDAIIAAVQSSATHG